MAVLYLAGSHPIYKLNHLQCSALIFVDHNGILLFCTAHLKSRHDLREGQGF